MINFIPIWRTLFLPALAVVCAIGAEPGVGAENARGAPSRALADYVARPDAAFKWSERSSGQVATTQYTELILTSQVWRDVTWKHQLYLVLPSTLTREAKHAVLIIAGSGWKEELNHPPERTSLPSNSLLYTRLAEMTGSPVAVLLQVPFQPLFDGLTEDWLIAYTFEQYLETGDSEWPLLLPMVKSCVRAMDVVQACMKKEWDVDIRTFTVTGASKRGWATWLTGAVDPRATAIAPMVIDVLNMAPQMKHAREVWGDFSPKVEPYTRRGLLDRLSTPEGRRLLEIVDPFSYRHTLRQPKLIVVGTNDDYWPVDASNLYWNELAGEKHLLFVPNNGHGIQDYARVTAGVLALHQSQSEGRPLPRLEWDFEETADAVSISFRAEPAAQQIRVWTALSPTTDFRKARWNPQPLTAVDGTARHRTVRTPDFQAIFVEGEFREGRQLPLNLSTNIRVVTPSPQTSRSP
jgi:PhoPQ-activated pathogenicity-related protein